MFLKKGSNFLLLREGSKVLVTPIVFLRKSGSFLGSSSMPMAYPLALNLRCGVWLTLSKRALGSI